MSAVQVRIVAYWSLVVVTLLSALSAVGGGVGMLVADGLSMPKSMLADTPFSTYTIPALILLLVVGGSQSLAAVTLLARRRSALLWSSVAGFGMLVWIIVEIGFIHTLMWAQTVYVVSGLLQLVLVIALLGVVSWLPRQDLRSSARSARGTSAAPKVLTPSTSAR
jgi:hypothetical protein